MENNIEEFLEFFETTGINTQAQLQHFVLALADEIARKEIAEAALKECSNKIGNSNNKPPF